MEVKLPKVKAPYLAPLCCATVPCIIGIGLTICSHRATRKFKKSESKSYWYCEYHWLCAVREKMNPQPKVLPGVYPPNPHTLEEKHNG